MPAAPTIMPASEREGKSLDMGHFGVMLYGPHQLLSLSRPWDFITGVGV